MNLDIRFLIADIKDFFNRDNYKKNHEYAIQLALQAKAVGKLVEGDPGEHPYHAEALAKHKQTLKSFKGKTIDTIAYGDSILDIPRGSYTAVEERFNFAISGSWADHMKQMANDLKSSFSRKPKPKNVIVGCFGNQFLAGQSLEETIKSSVDALSTISSLHKTSRLIVYGIPPVYNLNAAYNAFAFESAIYRWLVENHPNFVFIPMQRKFAGFLGLFPTIRMSSDGVHLSHRGVVTLDNFFEKAKIAPPGSIID